MKRAIGRLCRFRITLCALLVLAVQNAGAMDTVRLQLKWKHQFQFAGYYAAEAKGYYRDAGLQVEFIPASSGMDPVREVLEGRADYGVGTSDLILRHARGEPVVVLAAIFQHSPLALASLIWPWSQGAGDLGSLRGTKIMIEPESAEILAYLAASGLEPGSYRITEHEFSLDALYSGRADAMSIYVTDELYDLQRSGHSYRLYTPRSAGIDFYGDNLFTTQEHVAAKPAQVRAFREASRKGWLYAMTHPEEIIQLIADRYGADPIRLRFEARTMADLMHSDIVEPGTMYELRWQGIVETYTSLGMIPGDINLKSFLYDPGPEPLHPAWIIAIIGLFIFITLLVTVAIRLRISTRRLEKEIRNREQAEAALRQSDVLYRSIMDASPDCIALTDLQSHILMASPSASRLFGYMSDALAGRPLTDFLVFEERQQAASVLGRLARGDTVIPWKYQALRADGSVFPIEVNASLLSGQDGKPERILLIARDASARVQAETALRESEELHRSIMEASPDSIVITDSEGTILKISPSSLKILHLDSETDAIGHSVFEYIAPDGRARATTNIDRILRQENVGPGEYRGLRPDGTTFDLETNTALIRDAQGKPARLVLITRDVTARKQMEEELRARTEESRRLNEQLESTVAERTAALQASNRELEAFAYSISHDLRAPLRAMEGFSGHLVRELSGRIDARSIHLLERIQAGAKRFGMLINDLLELSKVTRQDFRTAHFDLSLAAHRILGQYQESEPSRKVKIGVEAGLGAKGDTRLLTILLEHLLDNAWKFSREREEAIIEVGCADKDGERAFFIRDNGSGFDMEWHQQLFKPFAKFGGIESGTGTGIGLITAKKIVERHGGWIRAESTLGQGSCFWFTLAPRSAPAVSSRP